VRESRHLLTRKAINDDAASGSSQQLSKQADRGEKDDGEKERDEGGETGVARSDSIPNSKQNTVAAEKSGGCGDDNAQKI
jgi:hypothetical protein